MCYPLRASISADLCSWPCALVVKNKADKREECASLELKMHYKVLVLTAMLFLFNRDAQDKEKESGTDNVRN